eukprot:jgi/Chrpa1/17308/Chrysochromulina_OHIO_Genome00023790-RA
MQQIGEGGKGGGKGGGHNEILFREEVVELTADVRDALHGLNNVNVNFVFDRQVRPHLILTCRQLDGNTLGRRKPSYWDLPIQLQATLLELQTRIATELSALRSEVHLGTWVSSAHIHAHIVLPLLPYFALRAAAQGEECYGKDVVEERARYVEKTARENDEFKMKDEPEAKKAVTSGEPQRLANLASFEALSFDAEETGAPTIDITFKGAPLIKSMSHAELCQALEAVKGLCDALLIDGAHLLWPAPALGDGSQLTEDQERTAIKFEASTMDTKSLMERKEMACKEAPTTVTSAPATDLSTILSQMTDDDMKAFAGKHRIKGAKKKEQYVLAVQLTLGMRGDAGLADLPVELQIKVQGSKTALAELQRLKLACGECATWDELERVLASFPPAVLLTILLEEVSAEQMHTLAGKTRCKGATREDQLVFGVLLTLAEDAARVQRLPANARRRIDAAPSALEWTEMMRTRAKKEVLEKVPDWRGFLDMLCEPPLPSLSGTAASLETVARAPSASGAAEQVKVQAQAPPDEEEGERIVLWFIKADKLRGCDDRVLPRFQDLQRQRPDWFEEKEITLEGACKHEYADEVLAVAHRWEQPAEPDTQGKQFAAMCAYVRGKPAIKLVWVDFSCAPQKERTPAEELVFKRTLRFVSLLFLGSRVLILCDRTYMTRFWTLLEAWISMQMATDDGLVPAPREKRRCDIVPIHDASSVTVSELEALVAGKSLDQIHEMLESPDISVTNLNDKNTQLPKLLALDSQVGQVVRKMAPPPKLTLAGGAPRPSRGVAGVGTGADAPAAPSKDERLQRLIQQVRSGSADAAGALADMGDNESRVAIARAGGIVPLVALLTAQDPAAGAEAAAALQNLAFNAENKVLIAQAGAIAPLVTLVKSGTDDQKEYAAAALWNLAYDNAENQV